MQKGDCAKFSPRFSSMILLNACSRLWFSSRKRSKLFSCPDSKAEVFTSRVASFHWKSLFKCTIVFFYFASFFSSIFSLTFCLNLRKKLEDSLMVEDRFFFSASRCNSASIRDSPGRPPRLLVCRARNFLGLLLVWGLVSAISQKLVIIGIYGFITVMCYTNV